MTENFPHRHKFINAQGGQPLVGRVPNGTIRVCTLCWAQQIKVRGCWEPNRVPVAIAHYEAGPRRCECGEPEDGGDFGWFDHADGNTYCNACGTIQK